MQLKNPPPCPTCTETRYGPAGHESSDGLTVTRIEKVEPPPDGFAEKSAALRAFAAVKTPDPLEELSAWARQVLEANGEPIELDARHAALRLYELVRREDHKPVTLAALVLLDAGRARGAARAVEEAAAAGDAAAARLAHEGGVRAALLAVHHAQLAQFKAISEADVIARRRENEQRRREARGAAKARAEKLAREHAERDRRIARAVGEAMSRGGMTLAKARAYVASLERLSVRRVQAIHLKERRAR